VADRTVEAWIDHVALVSALEQISGLVGGGAVKGQPVKHDIEAKAEAMLPTQRRQFMNRFFDRTAIAEGRARPGQIGDQQRIVAARQEGVEANIAKAQVGDPGEPSLPIVALRSI
jgi:hypothetical protein